MQPKEGYIVFVLFHGLCGIFFELGEYLALRMKQPETSAQEVWMRTKGQTRAAGIKYPINEVRTMREWFIESSKNGINMLLVELVKSKKNTQVPYQYRFYHGRNVYRVVMNSQLIIEKLNHLSTKSPNDYDILVLDTFSQLVQMFTKCKLFGGEIDFESTLLPEIVRFVSIFVHSNLRQIWPIVGQDWYENFMKLCETSNFQP